jgi:hypothetical protein
MLEIVKPPHIQLVIYCSAMIFTFLFRWQSTPFILLTGSYLLIVWAIAGGVIGISPEQSWVYYLYLCGALLVGYGVLVGLFYLSDKWGDSYNSEGAIGVLIPIIVSPIILAGVIAVKALWALIVFIGS